MEANSLLPASAGKDYQDLQILHGDLVAPHDHHTAESFYTAVIQQCAGDDAQYSEIRARAYCSRARSRVVQGRRSSAKRDFEAAAEIWKYLQDPAYSDAEWSALTCSKQLSIDPTLLQSKSHSSAVRVRALRIHDQRLASIRGRAARRTAPVTDRYLDRLIEEAQTQVAIDEVEPGDRLVAVERAGLARFHRGDWIRTTSDRSGLLLLTPISSESADSQIPDDRRRVDPGVPGD